MCPRAFGETYFISFWRWMRKNRAASGLSVNAVCGGGPIDEVSAGFKRHLKLVRSWSDDDWPGGRVRSGHELQSEISGRVQLPHKYESNRAFHDRSLAGGIRSLEAPPPPHRW